MSDKYQEALDDVFMHNMDECESDSFDDCKECTYKNICRTYNSYILLQKLIDKATPKKPTKRQETDAVIGEYTAYDCPVCKQEQIITFELEIVGFKAPYCRHCGQTLDWSDEDGSSGN